MCIERLRDDFYGGLGRSVGDRDGEAKQTFVHVPNPDLEMAGHVPGDEAPILFRRGGMYYLLVGSGYCDCKMGATTWVYTAPHPLGPWTLQGNIGYAPDGSPVTKAQQRDVFRVDAPPGSGQEATYVWVGNNFIPGEGGPGTCTNGGLLYWSPLAFRPDGSIAPMAYNATASWPLP